MIHERINREDLLAVQSAVEGLSSISVTFYDEGGTVVASPNQDPVVSLLCSTEQGKEEYRQFISETVRTAVFRKEITYARSPFEQYHFFIPCRVGDVSLVLAGGAFYLSEDEFRQFISRSGHRYRLMHHQFEKISKQVRIREYEDIKKLSEKIRQLYLMAMRNSAENKQLKKKYVRTKAIMRLLANMEEQGSEERLYSFFAEMLTFLFNVEALSIMIQQGEHFESIFSAGRFKEIFAPVRFSQSAWVIVEALKKRKPIYCDDLAEIRGLGLGEEITSVSLFPCFNKDGTYQLLCLYNTELSSEEEDEILEVCHLIAALTTTVSVKDSYVARMKEMTMLNFAMSGLALEFDRPDVLYNSIVDTAVRISKAEKGSLMLAEDGQTELSVKAVHGVNKWFFKDLKVRAGEGIAGKVFQDSVPLISKNIEKEFSIQNRPIYKTHSFMSIPLKVGEETIGVLNISDKITGEVFMEEDLALIHSFANYASIALKGSNYYNLAENMKELSLTDPLTNLYNRRYFQERLDEEIVRSERHKLNLSLCIIDIDDFKLFNDTEGHPAGDDILIRFSRLILESLRTIDVLARIGGEEFAVIMPQTDSDEAFFVAERIRNTVKYKLDRTWKQYQKEHVTVSIGISTFPADGAEVKRLISNADKAMYRAKMHGKDKTFAWDGQTTI